MYITLETDYAIRIVLYLCTVQKRVDANKISENTGVTLRFALKILRKLVSQGLMTSYKGVSGGYQIAKESKNISLLAVVETISGEYRFSRCLDAEYDCSNPNNQNIPSCKVKKEFENITELIRDKLDNITFDQFV